MSCLTDLPGDVLRMIITPDVLSIRDIFILCTKNRRLYNAICLHETLWRDLAREYLTEDPGVPLKQIQRHLDILPRSFEVGWHIEELSQYGYTKAVMPIVKEDYADRHIRAMYYIHHAISGAAKGNQIALMKEMFPYMNNEMASRAFILSSEELRKEIFPMLSDLSLKNLYLHAGKHGDVGLLAWVIDRFGFNETKKVLFDAVDHEHMSIVKYIHERGLIDRRLAQLVLKRVHNRRPTPFREELTALLDCICV